jgi:hypothetical protein
VVEEDQEVEEDHHIPIQLLLLQLTEIPMETLRLSIIRIGTLTLVVWTVLLDSLDMMETLLSIVVEMEKTEAMNSLLSTLLVLLNILTNTT